MLRGILKRLQRRIQMTAIRLRKRAVHAAELDLHNCWQGISGCLFFWKGEDSDTTPLHLVLERMRIRFPGVSVTLVLLPDQTDSVPMELFERVIRLEKQHLNFWGLPTGRVVEKIKATGAELAVDLSSKFNPLSGYHCLAAKPRLRVGFAGPSSDLVFNYQVAPLSQREGIDRYKALARYLG